MVKKYQKTTKKHSIKAAHVNKIKTTSRVRWLNKVNKTDC